MQVKEIMTKSLQFVPADSSVIEAAQKMKQFDVGVLPVGDQDKVLGMVTDRDITIQAVASGRSLQDLRVQDVMSSDVKTVPWDADVKEASQIMADSQIRRLIVVDPQMKPVGIISLGDLATEGDEEQAGQALQDISEPNHPRH